MATVHVKVRTDKVADRVGDWAFDHHLEFYVAPREETTRGQDVDHVTINGIDDYQCGELMKYIVANGWKTEITVE